MKFLKNIVITFGLLCAFVQMNAMESKVNKVILGTWENRTDKDIQIFEFNSLLDSNDIPLFIIPAHTTIAIDRAISAAIKSKEGATYARVFVLKFDVYRLSCNLLRPSFRATLSSGYSGVIDDVRLNLSNVTKKINVIINGIIEQDLKRSKIALVASPVETPSLKEQSMKVIVQQLKKEGKSLEEAKEIVRLDDLHNLLLEYWNQ